MVRDEHEISEPLRVMNLESDNPGKETLMIT
jgi:hypothetical protein